MLKIEKIKEFIEHRLGELLKLFILLVVLLLIGLVYLFNKDTEVEENTEEDLFENLMIETDEKKVEQENIEENENEQMKEESENINEEKILVDLKGAVQSPGVYEMEMNARVIDCIDKAGGFLDNAEEYAVNLAQKLEDQMVIYIPVKGEELVEIPQIAGSAKNNNPAEESSQSIDLNKASKEDLKKLNGVGDVKAESIINYREKNGFFVTIEDIKKVSGIGESTFDKLEDQIVVSP